MKRESLFNSYLGKSLAKEENAELFIEEALRDVRNRSLELNNAREKMASGYQEVLSALSEAFPHID